MNRYMELDAKLTCSTGSELNIYREYFVPHVAPGCYTLRFFHKIGSRDRYMLQIWWFDCTSDGDGKYKCDTYEFSKECLEGVNSCKAYLADTLKNLPDGYPPRGKTVKDMSHHIRRYILHGERDEDE